MWHFRLAPFADYKKNMWKKLRKMLSVTRQIY